MRVHVDPEACLGCGVCATIIPEVFSLGDEGFAVVLLDPVDEFFRDLVQQAADECTEEAIRVEETHDYYYKTKIS